MELLLSDRSAEYRKYALQRICTLYRRGQRLPNPISIRQTAVGLLYDFDDKVVRWALNALALIGVQRNVQAILECAKRNVDRPETLAAAIAALFAVADDQKIHELLKGSKIPLEGALLVASAQHSDLQMRELLKRKVNIEKAPPLELRMASLLIGLNHAPDGLFHPRLPNSEIAGEMNRHDDNMVSQYSVWAMAENKEFSLRDLRLPVKDLEGYKANVRGWIYRLIVKSEDVAKSHHEYVVMGSEDTALEARLGLSRGIRNRYYDGIEMTTVPWLEEEENENIRLCLLDHMAANSNRCGVYETPVKQAYKHESSLVRARLEAAASGTGLYAELRRVALNNEQAELGLFSEEKVMVTQNINTGGGNIGSVTATGDVQAGEIRVISQKTELPEVREFLTAYADLVQQLSGEDAKHAAKIAGELGNTPNQSVMARILEFLEKVKEGTGKTAAITEAAKSLYESGSELLSQLPVG